MTNYAAYIAEREGLHIIEDQNGFATYSFGSEYCYIRDIYVVPEQRQNGIAAAYANKIATHAKLQNLNKLLGSVKPSANGSTQSLLVLLKYGFKLHTSDVDAIWLTKEI